MLRATGYHQREARKGAVGPLAGRGSGMGEERLGINMGVEAPNTPEVLEKFHQAVGVPGAAMRKRALPQGADP